MKAVFHPGADTEFQQAIEYYQTDSLLIALRFYGRVMSAVASVEAHPFAWPRLRGTVRKCLVSDFPYKVLYIVEVDRLHRVAIMHA